MKISQIRKYRRRPTLSPQLMASNPLLLLGIDLPFVVVAAVSLKNAVALSFEMICVHFVTMMVAWLVGRHIKVWQRFILLPFVSTVIMLVSRNYIVGLIPNYESAESMYLYLIAINGMTLFQGCFLEDDASFSSTLRTTILNILTFTFVMFLFSILREYLGNGTLWGIPVPIVNKLTGLRSPFFGFILLGVSLAFARFIDRQFSVFQIFSGLRKDMSEKSEELP